MFPLQPQMGTSDSPSLTLLGHYGPRNKGEPLLGRLKRYKTRSAELVLSEMNVWRIKLNLGLAKGLSTSCERRTPRRCCEFITRLLFAGSNPACCDKQEEWSPWLAFTRVPNIPLEHQGTHFCGFANRKRSTHSSPFENLRSSRRQPVTGTARAPTKPSEGVK